MADTKQKEKDIFENMPVRKAVLTLAVPTVISQLIVLIYNLADTWFIGQTEDPLQVAAVTVSYPIFMLLGGLGNLFGIGGGSLISRLLGRGEQRNAGKIGTFVIWASAVATLFYSLLIFVFGRQALQVLGTGGETLGYARQYLFWTVVFGGIPMVLNQVLANIVRAQGRARTASIGMSVGGILNVALDPLFMFGLHMNVAGACNLHIQCSFRAVSFRAYHPYPERKRGKAYSIPAADQAFLCGGGVFCWYACSPADCAGICVQQCHAAADVRICGERCFRAWDSTED